MSTSMEFDVADDFGDEGQFLREPGTYHVAVQDVHIGTGPNGKAIDGFTLQLEVLGGTVAGEARKMFNHTVFNPRLNEKDGGTFTRKKQSKLLVALNLLNPALKGQKVSIDLEKAKGQQFVVGVEVDDYNSRDGKQYLRIAGLDTWHVDDPHCAGVPKNEAALKLIPAVLRHDAKWFEAIYKKNGEAGKAAPAATAAATAAPAASQSQQSRVNLDDL